MTIITAESPGVRKDWQHEMGSMVEYDSPGVERRSISRSLRFQVVPAFASAAEKSAACKQGAFDA